MARGYQALCPWILALPRQEGLSLELKELLCDIGRTVAAVEEGRAWGSDPSGGKPDWTKGKKKRNLSNVQT